MPISRIAIVNRGEPAMRLINGAREHALERGVDLRTIALHTDTDRNSMFVREADEAFELGPATFVDASGQRQVGYLDYERLEQALVETGADAAWVGWGFVAEHAAFAELCERLGVNFIGPSSAVMRRLGDKITSKQIAEASGVPVAAWSGGPVETVGEAHEHAERIGYPLLIKATAGGGGRGIRRVTAPKELDEAFESARAEALGAFGDGTVFLEELVHAAKHIEVQMIGDDAGTVWSVGVRDCSVQRRNQKIIEEAPSPVLKPDEERHVRDAAARLGRAAGYRNAGTVEFLYEPESGLFSFMEVNARLQVEHPITETTTGVDMVKLQLHVADGGRLIGDPPPTVGHAIEARVNAEDPEQGFAPSPGRIELLRLPTGPGVRVDTGVEEGDVIAPEFDSMIAKVIATGRTRPEALARLRRALSQTEIVVRDGTSNKAFLHDLLGRRELVDAEIDVGWVDRLAAHEPIASDHGEVAVVAAAINAYREALNVEIAAFRASALRGRPEVNRRAGRDIELQHRGQTHRLDVQRLGPGEFRVEVDGNALEVNRSELSRAVTLLTVNGVRHRVVSSIHGVTHFVEVDGQPHRILHDEGGIVRSPAPAVVVSIDVEPGDEVEPGQRLAVVEAMKMETAITADFAGTVREIVVEQNEQVPAGARLLIIEPTDTAGTTSDAEGLAFASLAADAATGSINGASRWLSAVRQLLLGYDVDPSRVAALSRPGQDLHGTELNAETRLEREQEILAIFADVVGLFGRVADPEEDDLLRHGTEGYLFDYLRRVEALGEGLPPTFVDRLERALSHFGVESLDPSWNLDRALYRIVRSHDRMDSQIDPVLRLLERRLEHPAPPDDDRRLLLEEVAQLTRTDYPAVHDLAREVIYREFDEPFLTSLRTTALNEAEEYIRGIEGGADGAALAEHVLGLVECPQPLKTTLSRRLGTVEPTVRSALLEVMTRRYYRIRELRDLSTSEADGASIAAAEYDLDGRRVHVVATHADRTELGSRLAAVKPQLATRADGDVVLDVYLWSIETIDDAALSDEVVRLVDEHLGDLQLRRVVIAASDPSSGVGTSGVRHLTLRPDGSGGYTLQDHARELHPMMAKRLELSRLENFSLQRIPTEEDIYLYQGTAKENRRDERYFAIAEVRDLTAVRDDGGQLVRLPELERVVHDVAGAIRRVQAQRPAGRRLLSNRIILYVWPTAELSTDDATRMVERLQSEIADLGLQKIQLLARVRFPNGDESQRVVELDDPGGGHPQLSMRRPTGAPIAPLGGHEQNVVRLRQRGLWDPYALLAVLAPSTSAAEGIPAGEFQEYDLEGERLVPIDREPGQNSANVVVGVVTNQSAKYPDGMRRVVIVGDPSRGMGNLAEAECSRINAAMALATELDVPLEWFAVSAGAKIAMDSGTENMDWIGLVLRRIIEFTQAGRELNIVITGISVGAQPYWNAEATMLMHTKGILVMTPESTMVLTGKDALDYSGGVSAENNLGIGGYERIMGPNGQAQYLAHDVVDACRLLLQHYDYTYVQPGERFPRNAPTSDPSDRDVRSSPHGGIFPTIAELFDERTNPGRKLPFEMRQVMAAAVDQDHPTMERWFGMRDAEVPIVWDAYLGGHPVCLLGFEAKNLPRLGMVPADGPDHWTSSTLFPRGSKKIARAINATSGNRPLVVLASLSGFDGSPESMRSWQLEFGAEIGRAIVNFRGPIVFCVVSRYHGGAFVVFSGALNDHMEVAALEGSHASVIGGAPAAAVVFARDVRNRTEADPRVSSLREEVAAASGADRSRLAAELARVRSQVNAEKMGEVADEFDGIHNVERAKEVGSVDRIVPPAELRPYLIEAVERGIATELGNG
ncbi:MAG: carboxyl transferase domain-containing protein [Actinomycetota bacterium]